MKLQFYLYQYTQTTAITKQYSLFDRSIFKTLTKSFILPKLFFLHWFSFFTTHNPALCTGICFSTTVGNGGKSHKIAKARKHHTTIRTGTPLVVWRKKVKHPLHTICPSDRSLYTERSHSVGRSRFPLCRRLRSAPRTDGCGTFWQGGARRQQFPCLSPCSSSSHHYRGEWIVSVLHLSTRKHPKPLAISAWHRAAMMLPLLLLSPFFIVRRVTLLLNDAKKHNNTHLCHCTIRTRCKCNGAVWQGHAPMVSNRSAEHKRANPVCKR